MQIKVHFLLPIFLLILLSHFTRSAEVHDEITRNRLDNLLRKTIKLAENAYKTILKSKLIKNNGFPRKGKIHSKEWKRSESHNWAAGYYPGVLWRMFTLTLDRFWSDNAIKFQEKQRQYVHSIRNNAGLMIMPSYGLGLKAGFGKEKFLKWKELVIRAAHEYVATNRPNIDVIPMRAWTDKKNPKAIVAKQGQMASLDILYQVSKWEANSTLSDIATRHATKSMEFLRPDGSTFETISFNDDGSIIRKFTQHGFSESSTHAKEHAWFILGCVETYKWTFNTKFLDAAKKAADYFITNLPNDKVPYWDFEAKQKAGKKYVPRDSSAGAIAAYALLQLYVRSGDKKYFDASEAVAEAVLTLCSAEKLPIPAVLANGTDHFETRETDMAIIWGDYYILTYAYEYFKIEKQ